MASASTSVVSRASDPVGDYCRPVVDVKVFADDQALVDALLYNIKSTWLRTHVAYMLNTVMQLPKRTTEELEGLNKAREQQPDPHPGYAHFEVQAFADRLGLQLWQLRSLDLSTARWFEAGTEDLRCALLLRGGDVGRAVFWQAQQRTCADYALLLADPQSDGEMQRVAAEDVVVCLKNGADPLGLLRIDGGEVSCPLRLLLDADAMSIATYAIGLPGVDITLPCGSDGKNALMHLLHLLASGRAAGAAHFACFKAMLSAMRQRGVDLAQEGILSAAARVQSSVGLGGAMRTSHTFVWELVGDAETPELKAALRAACSTHFLLQNSASEMYDGWIQSEAAEPDTHTVALLLFALNQLPKKNPKVEQPDVYEEALQDACKALNVGAAKLLFKRSEDEGVPLVPTPAMLRALCAMPWRSNPAERMAIVTLASLLLEQSPIGGIVNVKETETDAGRTPLILAMENGNGALGKILLAKGASPTKADAYGRTPLLASITSGHPRILKNAGGARKLQWAAQSCGLLSKLDPAAMNATTTNGTGALHLALLHPNILAGAALVKELLELKAKHNLTSQVYGTPLSLAASQVNISAIRSLLEVGADVNHVWDIDGRTALHHLCAADPGRFWRAARFTEELSANEDVAVVAYRALRGGDDGGDDGGGAGAFSVLHKDKEGDTPLLLAAGNRYAPLVDVLAKELAALNPPEKARQQALLALRFVEHKPEGLPEAWAAAGDLVEQTLQGLVDGRISP